MIHLLGGVNTLNNILILHYYLEILCLTIYKIKKLNNTRTKNRHIYSDRVFHLLLLTILLQLYLLEIFLNIDY